MPALPTSEMAQTFGPKDLVTLEELTISNMWEVAALIEVLEKKGVMKKQDILDAIRGLQQDFGFLGHFLGY